MSESSSDKIARIVSTLDRLYDADEWWETDSIEEVMIGAILTQQARWATVRTAITRLKEQGLCSLPAIRSADHTVIEELIRPTGYFRQKTKMLKILADFVIETHGGIENLEKLETTLLRDELLTVHGIGEETADSILAYGFGRGCLVIDAYTQKIFSCAGIKEKGETLRLAFEEAVPETRSARQRVHGHIVEYAKEFCNRSRCEECLIKNLHE
jgi:endonuclease-3 related protein